jgi:DNA-binding MarR family transcriptional regulator
MGQDFEHDLFFLLHDVARLSRVEADKRARRQGMTRAQWALLLRLARNPGMSQKEIADLLEVEPISVARLVDRMEAAGLIERRADEQDRRIWRLHLLPAAIAQLTEINRERETLASSVSNGLSSHIHEIMVQGLRQMKTNLLQLQADHHLPAPGEQNLRESA